MPTQHSTTTDQGLPRNTRYHAMDALRAVAMALGVVLHASVSYMHTPMPGLLWPTDPSPAMAWGWFFDGIFWYLHGFRIPLFFVIAGFFAVMLCDSRGGGAFILHRIKRILVPLIGAIVAILPITYLVWGLGLMQSQHFHVTWKQVRKLRFHDAAVARNIFGLAHLWFLEYLFLISLGLYLLWRIKPMRVDGPPRWTDRLLCSPCKPLPLTLVTGVIYFARPDLFSQFENQWLPDPVGLIHYTVFFIVGAWMYRLRNRLEQLTDYTWPYLAISTASFIALAILLRQTLTTTTPIALNTRLALAAATALFCWFSVFGYLGLFLRIFKSHQPIVRYGSDAAYWVYLSHLPIVAILQITLLSITRRWDWMPHPFTQFLIVLSGALAATMLTYRYWVRYTFIGAWLNGPRYRPQPAHAAPTQPTTTVTTQEP